MAMVFSFERDSGPMQSEGDINGNDHHDHHHHHHHHEDVGQMLGDGFMAFGDNISFSDGSIMLTDHHLEDENGNTSGDQTNAAMMMAISNSGTWDDVPADSSSSSSSSMPPPPPPLPPPPHHAQSGYQPHMQQQQHFQHAAQQAFQEHQQQQQQKQQQQQQQQQFSSNMTFSPYSPPSMTMYQRLPKPLKEQRSIIAKSRKRDHLGHFLPKGVGLQLEHMEHRVRNLEEALSEKNKEIEKLQQELEATKKINQNLIESRYYINGIMPFLQHYTPNAQIPTHDRKPFQEQIDFSQIRLRKSNSNFMTEAEKREVIANQECWEEQQRFNEFMRKMEEHQRWVMATGSSPITAPHASRFGGPPYYIYNDPIKIGNAMVPAFTEKIDFANIELKKAKEVPDSVRMEYSAFPMPTQTSPSPNNLTSPVTVPVPVSNLTSPSTAAASSFHPPAHLISPSYYPYFVAAPTKLPLSPNRRPNALQATHTSASATSHHSKPQNNIAPIGLRSPTPKTIQQQRQLQQQQQQMSAQHQQQQQQQQMSAQQQQHRQQQQINMQRQQQQQQQQQMSMQQQQHRQQQQQQQMNMQQQQRQQQLNAHQQEQYQQYLLQRKAAAKASPSSDQSTMSMITEDLTGHLDSSDLFHYDNDNDNESFSDPSSSLMMNQEGSGNNDQHQQHLHQDHQQQHHQDQDQDQLHDPDQDQDQGEWIHVDAEAYDHFTRRFMLGGPPSDIYTPPTKIGNLMVPAFRQKVDYSERIHNLRKTTNNPPPLVTVPSSPQQHHQHHQHQHHLSSSSSSSPPSSSPFLSIPGASSSPSPFGSNSSPPL